MTQLTLRDDPEVLHVVIPAHNEQELLPRCLESVRRACDLVTSRHPELVTRTTLVADRCSDRTADIAAGQGADVVEIAAGGVGASRRAGVGRAVELAAGAAPTRVWLANTDADTVVPEHWLVAQLMFARLGVSMVVGTVAPDATDLDARSWQAWHRLHERREGHPHVHGANLGLSLDAYLKVGGFPSLPLHEDVLLVEAVKVAGFRWCATNATRVTTSGRRHARAMGGFASYLAALSDAAS